MIAPGSQLVAIGVGNVLLGDDGAGVRVVEGLRRLADEEPGTLPPDTRLVDGGTLGLDLLQHVHDVRGLLLIDAAARGEPPGSVTVRRDGQVAGGDAVAELLAVAGLLGVLPPAVTVVEIGVGEIAPGIGLSSAVEAALPAATMTALRELRAMAQPAGVSA